MGINDRSLLKTNNLILAYKICLEAQKKTMIFHCGIFRHINGDINVLSTDNILLITADILTVVSQC